MNNRRLRWYISFIHSMPFEKLAVEDRSYDGDETVLRWDLESGRKLGSASS